MSGLRAVRAPLDLYKKILEMKFEESAYRLLINYTNYNLLCSLNYKTLILLY